MKAQEVIDILGLEPLPEEGGFYREIYRAEGVIPEQVLGKNHQGERNYGTAIYYLITRDEFSALHRLPQDEIFHFYLGDPVEMLQINPEGLRRKLRLGPGIGKGQELQVVVPGGYWQGLKVLPGGKWALLGASVAPGFDFRDFEAASREDLLQKFPEYREDIIRFTR